MHPDKDRRAHGRNNVTSQTFEVTGRLNFWTKNF